MKEKCGALKFDSIRRQQAATRPRASCPGPCATAVSPSPPRHETHVTLCRSPCTQFEARPCRRSPLLPHIAGCDYASVEQVNADTVNPLLTRLVAMPFMRYFKVSLDYI